MTNALSRLHRSLETWSFQYNCYEAVHPWTPFCTDSALDLGLTVFQEAFKLYTPLYLFSQVMRQKYDRGSFKITGLSILRSTTFISLNAFFALFFFCSSQYLTGKFYYYVVAYIPGFLASSMAVLIEKPNRRSSLAFYVANVASETLFKIFVARGYLKPVKYGQVYLFTLSIATIMYLAKKHGFEEDPLSTAIKLVVGPEEAKTKLAALELSNKSSGRPLAPKGILNWLKFLLLTARHEHCPHPRTSCLNYVSYSAARALVIGFGAQLCLRLMTKLPQIMKDPSLALSIIQDRNHIKLGLFLLAFTGLYKGSNCGLRWLRDGQSKPASCFVAGLIAGPALALYPSPTVALYVLWKCLEALFHEGVRRGSIKNKDLFIVTLYGLATSQLFYSALMDPHHMKKSYMAFLHRISHHRLHMVNRSVLDIFGTGSSTGYEDFFPDLHPNFMSKAYLGSIWIWLIEQKIRADSVLSY